MRRLRLNSTHRLGSPRDVKSAAHWRRVSKLFAPYRFQVIVVLLLILLHQLVSLIAPVVTARIIDSAIPRGNLRELLLDVGLVFVASAVGIAIAVVQDYLNSTVGEGIMRDLRISIISHLHEMPLSFFTNTRTGEIMNRVSNDIDIVDSLVTGTLSAVVTSVITLITALITMFVWNWRLAIVALMIVPLMLAPIKPVGTRLFAVTRKTREVRDEMASMTQETLSISGITLVKSFVREAFEKCRFYETLTRLMRLEIRSATIGRWFLAVGAAMTAIGPMLIWLSGGWLAIHERVSVGVIVAFAGMTVNRLYATTSSLGTIRIQFATGAAVFARIFEYLDLATEQYVPTGAVSLPCVEGNMSFHDVSFCYDPGYVVLDRVNFDIRPGQFAALVGPSGSGKTSISQLITRFYSPQCGQILIDGHDIQTLTLESLRRNIGIVAQETYLFHDTIENNLRYGCPQASDAELIAATSAANIHQFICTLPNGYRTLVGERGHRLSGGERQRLAIARVLLKNPRILILDEATSSLDSHNEAAIQAAIELAMRGRTSLVIAHRLSTIIAADVIFVLDRGVIVERGSHAALLDRGGLYSQLYRAQRYDAQPRAN